MVANAMIVVFLLGYLAIAMEHKLQVNKAASALITGIALWVVYVLGAPLAASAVSPVEFHNYITDNPSLKGLPLIDQCIGFITNVQIVENLGEISETLFFLIGAMTIVEIIDVHGGFSIITNRIKTRGLVKLLWIIAFVTFFMSAVLDNMTTSIVMVMLLRRIIPNYKERWIFASMIIIAANGGGAWSPIGDVTTIMLWVKGNVSTTPLVTSLLLPCLVSTVIPVALASRMLRGRKVPEGAVDPVSTNVESVITPRERTAIFFLGVCCLLAVPVFKSVTHLPPFMGVMAGLGIVWVYTDFMYSRKIDVSERYKHRVTSVIRHIDTGTILFFLGILLAVGALQATGILDQAALFLNEHVHNVYLIDIVIGLLSAVVDNVPLVASAMGMYPVVDPAAVASLPDPEFMAHFVADGNFWTFLAYCAGVGGSILIIGSVAGVVTMGLEKINFTWYLRKISLLALLGYLAGAAVYLLQVFIATGTV